MQVPHQSLDDFTNIDPKPIPADPPRLKRLRRSGRFEVVKPVSRSNDLVKRNRFIRLAPLPGEPRFSWYHRSLAFSAALAVSALILGIFAGFYAPTEPAGRESDVVLDRQPDGILAPNGPDMSDLMHAGTGSRLPDRSYAVRSVVRRNPARPRILRSAHGPRLLSLRPHLVVSEFVPTTLVIYIENGEVKTRVEPHVAPGHIKKT